METIFDISKIPSEQLPELVKNLRMTGQTEFADDIENQLKQQKVAKVDFWLNQFVTVVPEMIEMKETAKILSCEDDPVLIIGDSGTGKELLAQALQGDRKGKFIPINCAGIPDTLIEAELFGHTKGAFTGAIAAKTGLLVEAKDGTIFLDEIGDLAYPMQAKLLRAIQEKKVRPMGATQEIDINCRIVAATHRPLDMWVKYNDMTMVHRFRSDLFWRISTFILRPLPLSKRSRDIPLIVRALDKDCEIGDVDKFCSYIKPSMLTGNVRSLQQYVRRYCVLGEWPTEIKVEGMKE
jgi:transcriptional regulator with PAS, ATPase and Fis domain